MNLALGAVPLLLFALAGLAPLGASPLGVVRWGSGLGFVVALLAVALGATDDAAQGTMLLLVTGLVAVVARFSATYLRDARIAAPYARWFLATAGAVTAVVAADHLAVLALAWTATSLTLHRLLTLEPERRGAQLVAHKKFLVSRLADACMFGAVLLLGQAAGDLGFAALAEWARAPLPWTGHLAMVLVVAAVALRSAQLPFHGWLLQVMEAPTPVSALLHAGIVNIGGYVLLRLATPLAAAPAALALLVVVGTLTAVVAALVRTTRVSVKVALAWSTSAQMGFLLLECGLGAWSLALLHIVAHSAYKAHAFLTSGSTVEAWRVDALAARPGPVPLRAVAVAGVGVASAAAVLLTVAARLAPGAVRDPNVLGFLALLALALVPMLARAAAARALVAWSIAARAALIAGVTVAWHIALPTETAPSPALWLVPMAGFLLLFGVQVLLAASPAGRLARALQPALFAGLYLDEAFTRLTFRVWPPTPVPA